MCVVERWIVSSDALVQRSPNQKRFFGAATYIEAEILNYYMSNPDFDPQITVPKWMKYHL